MVQRGRHDKIKQTERNANRMADDENGDGAATPHSGETKRAPHH